MFASSIPRTGQLEVTDEGEVATVDVQDPERRGVRARDAPTSRVPTRRRRRRWRSRRCARSIRTSTPSRCWRRIGDHRRHRLRRRVLRPRRRQRGHASAASARPAAPCSSSASGPISATRTSPDLIRGVFRSVEETGGLTGRTCGLDACRRSRPSWRRASESSSRNAAIRVEKLLAALVDDVGVPGAGDVDPVGRRGEGVGQPACFVDRDERVIGSVDDQGRAGDAWGRVDRSRAAAAARRRACRRAG